MYCGMQLCLLPVSSSVLHSKWGVRQECAEAQSTPLENTQAHSLPNCKPSEPSKNNTSTLSCQRTHVPTACGSTHKLSLERMQSLGPWRLYEWIPQCIGSCDGLAIAIVAYTTRSRAPWGGVFAGVSTAGRPSSHFLAMLGEETRVLLACLHSTDTLLPATSILASSTQIRC